MRIDVQHCTEFSLLSAQALAHCMRCFRVMSVHGFLHRFSHAQLCGRLLVTQTHRARLTSQYFASMHSLLVSLNGNIHTQVRQAPSGHTRTQKHVLVLAGLKRSWC